MNERRNELNELINEWTKKWMNEWMNEWTNKWMNEGMNEWMIEQMKEKEKWMNEWINNLHSIQRRSFHVRFPVNLGIIALGHLSWKVCPPRDFWESPLWACTAWCSRFKCVADSLGRPLPYVCGQLTAVATLNMWPIHFGRPLMCGQLTVVATVLSGHLNHLSYVATLTMWPLH